MLMNKLEFADACGKCQSTVYNWIKDNKDNIQQYMTDGQIDTAIFDVEPFKQYRLVEIGKRTNQKELAAKRKQNPRKKERTELAELGNKLRAENTRLEELISKLEKDNIKLEAERDAQARDIARLEDMVRDLREERDKLLQPKPSFFERLKTLFTAKKNAPAEEQSADNSAQVS